MRDQPAPGLAMPNRRHRCPISLTSGTRSNQDVIRALAQMANVNVVFDPAFQPTPISFETARQDLRAGAASDRRQHAELLPRDRRRAPSPSFPTRRPNAVNTRKRSVRTFFLSNADPKETMDVLRIVIDARRSA